MNLKNQIAAFFDFDETLLEVESGRMGIQWLWDRRLLHLGYIIKVQAALFFLPAAAVFRRAHGQNSVDFL